MKPRKGMATEIMRRIGKDPDHFHAHGPSDKGKPVNRVLLVEDETALRELEDAVLRVNHFLTTPCRNGEEAVHRLESAPAAFQFVILDLHIPGISGLDVLARIKALRPDLPVLMTTGYATREEETRALATGAAGFLKKPFELNELVRRVKELLPQKAE